MTLTLHAELQALARCPSINGHIIMGSFVPADTVDIGCLVAMEREEGGVPGKVCTIRVCVHVHVCCVRCVACMPVRVYLHTPSHVGVCISCVSCGACPVSRFLMFRFWVFCAGGHVVGAVRLSGTCDFQNHQTNDLANVTIRGAHTKSIVEVNWVHRLRTGCGHPHAGCAGAALWHMHGTFWAVVSLQHCGVALDERVCRVGHDGECTVIRLSWRVLVLAWFSQLTSFGSLGLDMAWAPHTPFAKVPLTVGVGAVSDKVVVVDGQPAVRVSLTCVMSLTRGHVAFRAPWCRGMDVTGVFRGPAIRVVCVVVVSESLCSCVYFVLVHWIGRCDRS